MISLSGLLVFGLQSPPSCDQDHRHWPFCSRLPPPPRPARPPLIIAPFRGEWFLTPSLSAKCEASRSARFLPRQTSFTSPGFLSRSRPLTIRKTASRSSSGEFRETALL